MTKHSFSLVLSSSRMVMVVTVGSRVTFGRNSCCPSTVDGGVGSDSDSTARSVSVASGTLSSTSENVASTVVSGVLRVMMVEEPPEKSI